MRAVLAPRQRNSQTSHSIYIHGREFWKEFGMRVHLHMAHLCEGPDIGQAIL